MVTYTSFMKDIIYSFINYRNASGQWCLSYAQNLKTFENYCVKNYPNEDKLTQEMVDSWCTKRNTEINNSCRTRIGVVIAFLNYTNSRNITSLIVPHFPKLDKKIYIPHHFTDEELNNFFYACDNAIPINNNKDTINSVITVPVFFRLLYSSGMRTTEARQLMVKDVDLTTGVININKTKGYDQHYVVVDNLMKEYLINYNKKIEVLFPNRTYFFPTRNDKCHPKSWVHIQFKKYWKMYNNSDAIPYDLRHHYAITNINSWIDKGIEFTDKLYYLSKSMGHSNLSSTTYYYTLIPRMSDIFKTQINKTFDFIIPEVKQDE